MSLASTLPRRKTLGRVFVFHLPVSAEQLGYQSDAAFCRAFKRVFGASPGSVRRTGI